MIARGGLNISWKENRTLIYYPGIGTIAVLVVEDNLRSARIMFGPVNDSLQDVEVPPSMTPLAATAAIDSSGVVELFAVVEVEGTANRSLQIISMRSADLGTSWSPVDAVWAPGTTVSRFRAYSGDDGTHVIWLDSNDQARHIWKRVGEPSWSDSQLPTPSNAFIFDMRSFRDSCGDLVMFMTTLSHSGTAQLSKATWRNGEWSVPYNLPDINGAYTVEGMGSRSERYYGWMSPDRTGLFGTWIMSP